MPRTCTKHWPLSLIHIYPDYKTARDIVEVRHIKANLVSMNVDKLVQEGYLERYAVCLFYTSPLCFAYHQRKNYL